MAIENPTSFAGRAGVLGGSHDARAVSLLSADRQVLAGCLGYLEHEARPVLESRHGSLGLSLLAGQEGGVAIVESFWATHDAFWLSAETDALVRGELTRRAKRPVTAEDYEVPVFEREAPLRRGEAVRLTRVEVKPPGVPDVVGVYGDTAVPRLADTRGFCAEPFTPECGAHAARCRWRACGRGPLLACQILFSSRSPGWCRHDR